MSRYSKSKPPHGRTDTGPNPKLKAPGAPERIVPDDLTPLPEDISEDIPMVDGPPGTGRHMDIEGTLWHLVTQNRQLRKALEERSERDDNLTKTLTDLKLTPEQMELLRQANANSRSLVDLDAYERKIARAQKWGGWIWGLLAVVGAIFSAGVAYSVFMGANATDDEVERFVHDELADHNGGTHPETIDPETHEPIGDHPDMRKAIEANTGAVQEVKQEVGKIEKTQRKLDKRSEYQFELGRWQAEVTEAERRGRKPPRKPNKLDKLESDLMLGNYE